jgi:AcrR family transcriptional regulator
VDFMAPETATEAPANPPANKASRGRGRPRAFDEDEVLDALVGLFWEKGFEAASLCDIVETAGLNKSSLYNTFGSKDEVFARVLERYMEMRSAMFAEAMAGDGGLEHLGAYFSMLREEAGSDGPALGCLAVNASTELGLRDDRVAELSAKFRSTLSDGLRGPVERGARAGEIDPAMADTYLDMLVAFSVSFSVASRGGAGTDELLRQVDSMERLVDSWRLS